MPTPDSLRILTIIVPAILLVMGIKRPVYAVIAYMIIVYCKVSSYYPAIAAMKVELVLALLIICWLVVSTDFKTKLSLKYNPFNKYLFFFVLCVLLSFIVAWDHQYSWDNAVYHFIKVLFLYVMILPTLSTKQDLKIFIWSFIMMFAYLAYEPMYGFMTGTGGDQQIYGDIYIGDIGILSGHVALANNMNQMIPIAFYLIFPIKKPVFKILGSLPLLFCFLALVGSGSRGGVLGFMFFGLCLVFFSKERVKVGLVVGMLCVVILLFSGTASHTISRVDERSTKGRLTGLTHGIEMVKRGNILGVGPGCFLFARGRYFSYTMESHNIYGQVLGDLGIPGAIAWFFLIRQIFLNIIASKKRLQSLSMENNFLYKLAMGIQVSLIVRLFVSIASHGLYYFYWYIIAALSIAILKLTEDMAENRSESVAVT